MIPPRLRPGDEVRIVSPAISLGLLGEGQRRLARAGREGLGLRCSYSANAWVMNRFES